ncbi:hypothetical protein COS86_01835 [Candidatus Bathyarchaeota archaeon CG07_land_8_20_14_0_80_47_9]|nr:MAG: hypothetical protein COS86_01835 [Candidatus Bathyarchaeota archaeon CG07_land_8_20_14_0_80_47_9]
MSTHLKEKEEKIQQLLERLIEESARGTPIIVEGKKDVETLRALGVQGTIVSAKTGGKSRLDVISEVEIARPREVILLLDFDRQGKEWSKILKERLERARIRPNLKFWKELQGLVSKEVKDIEGLTSYIETLKKKAQNLNWNLSSLLL